jgi:CRISPR-associated endonuclease/helicase Cas3
MDRYVELSYPLLGRSIPSDNGYHFYAAISRVLDGHLPGDVAISSVGGMPFGAHRIGLEPGAALRVRCPSGRIAELLPLAGKSIDVGGHEVLLGVPRVRALTPAPTLASRLVSIKPHVEPGPFLGAAARQMAELGLTTGEAEIPMIRSGPHAGKFHRRVVRIKRVKIVGFALIVRGLSDPDSYQLLARGLGGRRHMGCGIFSPVGAGGSQRP